MLFFYISNTRQWDVLPVVWLCCGSLERLLRADLEDTLLRDLDLGCGGMDLLRAFAVGRINTGTVPSPSDVVPAGTKKFALGFMPSSFSSSPKSGSSSSSFVNGGVGGAIRFRALCAKINFSQNQV